MTRFDARLSTGAVTVAALLSLPVLWAGGAHGRTGLADPQQKPEAELPEGVTQEKIASGEKLYAETGCQVCHGKDAKGAPGMTADLTDGEWGFVEEGTYEALLAVITDGLTAERTGGLPMAPRGGKKLTDEQVQALAAYVWHLNRKGE